MDLHARSTKHRRRSVSSAVNLLHLRKLRKRDGSEVFDDMDSPVEPHHLAPMTPPPDEDRNNKPERTFFVNQSPLQNSTDAMPSLKRSNSSVVGNRIVSSGSTNDFRSSVCGRRYEMFGRPLPFVVHVVDGSLREEEPKVQFAEKNELQVDKELLVPMIVQHAVSLLRSMSGEKKEGLFRKCGNHKAIVEAQRQIEEGEKTIDQALGDLDVDSLGDILKRFLRMLPEPVIPACLTPHLLHAESLRTNPPRLRHGNRAVDKLYIDYVRATLCRLPACNRGLLFFLLTFFAEIVAEREKTRMDCRNLATIFATIFFGHPEVQDQSLYKQENDAHCVILEYFIQCHADVRMATLPLLAMEVSKSHKSLTKRYQSLIKGEIVYLVSRDEEYLYIWAGTVLEAYPASIEEHNLIPTEEPFTSLLPPVPLSASGEARRETSTTDQLANVQVAM